VEAYSKEFRRDVLRACDSGKGTREVALKFGVSESWVRRIKQERRELGKTAPSTTRRRRRIWEPYADRILKIIEQQPDLTLKELQQELDEPISVQSLCRALGQLKLTLKKSAEGGGARSTRRGRETCLVACLPDRTCSRTTCIYRRDVGQNQHDAAPRSIVFWNAARGQDAPRTLENHNIPGRPPNVGIDRSVSDRWSRQRRRVLGVCTTGVGAHSPATRLGPPG